MDSAHTIAVEARNRIDGKLNLSMVFVRRRLSWMIYAWLTCQIAGIAAAPITFCCKDVPTSANEDECCEGLMPGQYCPMHHKQAEQAADEAACKLRNACPPADAALVALAGGVGLLPPSTSIVSPFDLGDAPAALAPTAIARTDRPEAPPPRG